MQLADDEEMLELEDRIGDYQKTMEELNNKIKLHEVSMNSFLHPGIKVML